MAEEGTGQLAEKTNEQFAVDKELASRLANASIGYYRRLVKYGDIPGVKQLHERFDNEMLENVRTALELKYHADFLEKEGERMNEDLAVIISYSVEKNVGKILSGEIDESGINFEDARLAMDARSEEFTRREAEIKSGALPPYFDAWCKATVDVVMRILKQKVAKIK